MEEEEKWRRMAATPGRLGMVHQLKRNGGLSTYHHHCPGFSSSVPTSSAHSRSPFSTQRGWSAFVTPQKDLLPKSERGNPHLGVFRHAPSTRGFKDLFWEPCFGGVRPTLTQMDLARQERFRTRHVKQEELKQLPTLLYQDCCQQASERKKHTQGLDAERRGGRGSIGGERSDAVEEEYHMMMEDDDDVVLHTTKIEETEDEGGEVDREDLEGADPICVICLEGFTPWDVVRELPECHHIFHRRCIDLWLRGICSFEACYTRSCPTCKTPLSFTDDMSTSGSNGVMDHDHHEGGQANQEAAAVAATIAPPSTTPPFFSRFIEIPRWAYTKAGDALFNGGVESRRIDDGDEK